MNLHNLLTETDPTKRLLMAEEFITANMQQLFHVLQSHGAGLQEAQAALHMTSLAMQELSCCEHHSDAALDVGTELYLSLHMGEVV